MQREFWDLWNRHQTLIDDFFATVQRKGKEALLSSPSWCLCHNDLQPGNILQSPSGKLLIVDWDYPVWAPPERDLMFIETAYRAQFEAGYGPVRTNSRVFDYLSADWMLQELLDCAERVVLGAYVDQEERRWSLRYLRDLVAKLSS